MSCKLCEYIFDMGGHLNAQFNEQHPSEQVILGKNWKNGEKHMLIRVGKEPPLYAPLGLEIEFCPKCGKKL